jgi:hypothetical protein
MPLSANQILPAEQARQLGMLIRTLLDDGGAGPVEIPDESGQVLGLFVPAAPPEPPLEESPEFFAELKRRMESPGPVLSAEEFLAVIEELEQEAANGASSTAAG